MTKTLDDSFRDWETAAFGFGYGTGEHYIIPAIYRFFTRLREGRWYDHESIEAEFGPLAGWLLINALCGKDVVEYGTSPRHGWLTPEGEALRDYVLAKTADELIGVLNYDSDYVHCYRDHCNCDGPSCHNPFWTETKSRTRMGVNGALVPAT